MTENEQNNQINTAESGESAADMVTFNLCDGKVVASLGSVAAWFGTTPQHLIDVFFRMSEAPAYEMTLEAGWIVDGDISWLTSPAIGILSKGIAQPSPEVSQRLTQLLDAMREPALFNHLLNATQEAA